MNKNNLSKNQKSLINGLINTGVNKHVAKVLAFVAVNEGTKSIDIQMATELKQPEVSIAVRKLEDMGWVHKDSIKLGKSGRPFYEYSLNKGLDEIIAEIETRERAKVKVIEDNLKDIKDYAGKL